MKIVYDPQETLDAAPHLKEFIDYFAYKEGGDFFLTVKPKLEKKNTYPSSIKFIIIEDVARLDSIFFDKCKTQNIRAIFLALKDNNLRFLQQINIINLSHFVRLLKKEDFYSGVIGKVEAPDLVRFLSLKLDFLCLNQKDLERTFHVLGNLQKTKNVSTLKMSVKKADQILIKDLILSISIGAYQYETQIKQNVCFNIIADLKQPLSYEVQKDQIETVFSYDILLDSIKDVAYSRHYVLVECLAQDIAQIILAHREINRVMVRVEKLDLGPKAVGIEIERYAIA